MSDREQAKQIIDQLPEYKVSNLLLFLRGMLFDDELEDDLNTYGWTEWFSQGDQEPYKRKRPEAEVYNQTGGNYQKIIRQLTDLLPKSVDVPPDDGFEAFVTSR